MPDPTEGVPEFPSPAPSRVRLWGTLSGLLVFGLTLPLWVTLQKAESFYSQLEFRELPLVTELATQLGPRLWIPAAAVFLIGIVIARRGERSRAALLFFGMTIALVAVQILLLLALIYPLTKIP